MHRGMPRNILGTTARYPNPEVSITNLDTPSPFPQYPAHPL